MGERSAMARKHSRHYALASVTLSAVLAVSRPALQAKVFAVGNEYDWTKHEDNDLLGGANDTALPDTGEKDGMGFGGYE